jgi:GDP/UDP-N,N'-diacetylbacillosamine 2-epimerase (hydrolysing)
MEMLEALDSFPDIGLIFTMPNADTSSQLMARLIEKYVKSRDNAASYSSLGVERYLSALACVDGVIGNSSSGLLEAPILKKGTINIGNRQQGRVQAKSVISCEPDRLDIQRAITKLLSSDFQSMVKSVTSPFGVSGACEKIVKVIKLMPKENLLKKVFCDHGNQEK